MCGAIALFSSTWLRKAWFWAYLHADLSASPAGRSALHLVKLLPTVLLNSSVEQALSWFCYDVSQMLSRPFYVRVQTLTFCDLT